MSQSVKILTAPLFDPGAGRIEVDMPEGLTLEQIVALSLPAAQDADLDRVRVTILNERGSHIILRPQWGRVKPRAGISVIIRVIPGSGGLRSVLSIVVSIAAVAVGGVFGAAMAGTFGIGEATWAAIGVMGATVVGNLLVNALIPPVSAETETSSSYSITGWKNRYEPGAVVPFAMGTMRYAPPFAATPYTEIVGDDQYVRALFCLGEGELSIDDMRLGETSLSEYDEVSTEVRYGIAGELPVSLYTKQVVEEQIGVELTRPFPRDDDGEITQIELTGTGLLGGSYTYEGNAPTVETPVVRTTGDDASGVSIIIAFPAGLVRYNSGGAKITHSVQVRVDHRLIEADEWQAVTTLTMTAKKAEGFYRQHSWTFPTRGRWQVRLTMITDETEDSKITQRTTWAALQTIRPEYPITYPRPLALVALRIKATHQINGSLDNFNCLISRVCRSWDAASATWVRSITDNPAALYREVLQHASNPKAVGDAGLDLAQIADWAEWCDDQGLTYNAVLEDQGATLRDTLTEIAAAGRATPRHDGISWGVVIDRPLVNTMIVDHVNPRNSWSFKWSRAYIDPPHAFTVTFSDADNDYAETERVVRWPGYDGEITLTEQLALPGKVYAAEVWREARRRQLETIHRPDTYEVSQDGAVRQAVRGDAIALSHDVLSRVQVAARIKSVEGWLVELDDYVEMQSGTSYAIRFRVFENDSDALGTSVVRTVRTQAGTTAILTLTGIGPSPVAGVVIHFGPASVESYTQIVSRIEATQDMCAILRTIDAAPEIDLILADTEIPAWSSRIGAEIDANMVQPSAPRFSGLTSGVTGTDEVSRITFAIAPGSGVIVTASYHIDHRLSGTSAWTTMTIPAANGGGNVDTYATGQTVEFRACGISATSIAGPYSAIVSITVGAGDADIPAALDDASVSITTLLGGALIQFATGSDESTSAVQIYRSTSPTLDREIDAVGSLVPVSVRQSYSSALGDTTRTNLISNGAMSSSSVWIADAGWVIDSGKAQHSSGAAGQISQPLSATAGKYYRIGYTVAGRTSGALQTYLSGGSDRPGSSATGNGLVRDRIQSVTGNDTIDLRATADFDGSVDDVSAYLETSACLTAGTHYVWIEPQNTDGVAGPATGPFTVEII